MLRPNFFAGQLLTEDDLQQIITYSNGKRRLTNRYAFGTGVVCGLEVVAAGPKEPGTVIVEPGYALDCCGNDIVLSCPYTIDVNAMIRAVGLDCGDPCADASGGSDRPRKYLLCVRYTECRKRAGQPVLAQRNDRSASTPVCRSRARSSSAARRRNPSLRPISVNASLICSNKSLTRTRSTWNAGRPFATTGFR